MADTGPFPHCNACNLSFKDRRALVSHFYTNKHKAADKKAGNLTRRRNTSQRVAAPTPPRQDIAALIPANDPCDEYEDASDRYHCNLCHMTYPDHSGLENHILYSLPHLRRQKNMTATNTTSVPVESDETLEEMVGALSIGDGVSTTRNGTNHEDVDSLSGSSSAASESGANADNEYIPVQGTSATRSTPNTAPKSNKGGKKGEKKKLHGRKKGRGGKLWCDVCECKMKPGGGVSKHKKSPLHLENRWNRWGY